jgi:hypothetical protein
VRNVVTAAAAVSLLMAGMPNALAGERPASKPATSSSSNARAAAQSRADSGNMERKCVIMSCGTPWCFSVKR